MTRYLLALVFCLTAKAFSNPVEPILEFAVKPTLVVPLICRCEYDSEQGERVCPRSTLFPGCKDPEGPPPCTYERQAIPCTNELLRTNKDLLNMFCGDNCNFRVKVTTQSKNNDGAQERKVLEWTFVDSQSDEFGLTYALNMQQNKKAYETMQITNTQTLEIGIYIVKDHVEHKLNGYLNITFQELKSAIQSVERDDSIGSYRPHLLTFGGNAADFSVKSNTIPYLGCSARDRSIATSFREAAALTVPKIADDVPENGDLCQSMAFYVHLRMSFIPASLLQAQSTVTVPEGQNKRKRAQKVWNNHSPAWFAKYRRD